MSAYTRKRAVPFGFLLLGLMFGVLIGVTLTDMQGRHSPISRYEHVVRCLIIGPGLGLLAGLVMDLLISNNMQRRLVMELSIGLLILSFLVIWFVIDPNLSSIRLR